MNRWRETCVDGVLHVAFTAAVRADAAAHRCARTVVRHRHDTPRRPRHQPRRRRA